MNQQLRLAVFSAAFALAVTAAPVAHAFTFESAGSTNPDGTARYTDPDGQVSHFNSGNGQTLLQQGNTTFSFGQQAPSSSRSDTEHIFDPIGHPVGDH